MKTYKVVMLETYKTEIVVEAEDELQARFIGEEFLMYGDSPDISVAESVGNPTFEVEPLS